MISKPLRYLSVRSAKSSNEKLLDVRIGVEGLSLHSAPARNPLIPESQESRPRPDGLTPADFAMIGRKNIFEPFRELPTAAPPTQPAIDVAREIYRLIDIRPLAG